jgi:hypothetical protein
MKPTIEVSIGHATRLPCWDMCEKHTPISRADRGLDREIQTSPNKAAEPLALCNSHAVSSRMYLKQRSHTHRVTSSNTAPAAAPGLLLEVGAAILVERFTAVADRAVRATTVAPGPSGVTQDACGFWCRHQSWDTGRNTMFWYATGQS